VKAFCQDENTIKLKNEVTLTLTKTATGGSIYKITGIKNFNKTIDIAHNDVLKNDVDTNQVRLFFCAGVFMEQEQTVLVIKSGLKIALKYTAKIRIEDKDYFETTSVSPLFPNVKSIEEWPYKITDIILSDFSILETIRF
jgi:hypothetical protein